MSKLLNHLYPSEQERVKSINVSNSFFHLEGNDNPNKDGHISRERYNAIMDAYSDIVMEELIAGNSVRMFNNLGILRLIKAKPRRKYINFKLTRETGRVIHHDNLEHRGFNVFMRWFRSKAIFKNKRIWLLKLARKRVRGHENSLRTHINKHGVGNFVTQKDY